MRLIKASSLEFQEFFDSNTPQYAILSHTWGDEEVSFADARLEFSQIKDSIAENWFQGIDGFIPSLPLRAGLSKILHACLQALKDGLYYVWVDTCCIDKTSSAELSEAINSMFRWYEQAEVCYAYLADVPPRSARNAVDPGPKFASSRWFTRGWTLQELLAPAKVLFFASDWSIMGTRAELCSLISSITDIDAYFLNSGSRRMGRDNEPINAYTTAVGSKTRVSMAQGRYFREGCDRKLSRASVAERMSWASKRETTRVEDEAYCLLGILGVNMPLIYGEGGRAFIRLQEEVLKISDDLTILAWGLNLEMARLESHERFHPWRACSYRAAVLRPKDRSRIGFLAQRPADFRGCGKVIRLDIGNIGVDVVSTMNNRRLSIKLPLSEDRHPYLILPCRLKDHLWQFLAISLIHKDGNTFSRASSDVILVDHAAWDRWAMTTVDLLTRTEASETHAEILDYSFSIRHLPRGFSLVGVEPQATYDLSQHIIAPDPAFLRGTILDFGGEDAPSMTVSLNLLHDFSEAGFKVTVKATNLALSHSSIRVLMTSNIIPIRPEEVQGLRSHKYAFFTPKEILHVTAFPTKLRGKILLAIDIKRRHFHGGLQRVLATFMLDVHGYLFDTLIRILTPPRRAYIRRDLLSLVIRCWDLIMSNKVPFVLMAMPWITLPIFTRNFDKLGKLSLQHRLPATILTPLLALLLEHIRTLQTALPWVSFLFPRTAGFLRKLRYTLPRALVFFILGATISFENVFDNLLRVSSIWMLTIRTVLRIKREPSLVNQGLMEFLGMNFALLYLHWSLVPIRAFADFDFQIYIFYMFLFSVFFSVLNSGILLLNLSWRI
ncbi:heterokaryon incompatibility protein-domain-containing protein [Cladorrhinum samala]|uniref:Heterokaryon incompatibility protein-domain-containing protein n=1 Tax=Cladorrhinum samala TaxID=585594 RepID=A0AAV9I3T6_9PEZI|nr:heterokaryon incompatibility protein-domain-containing protein [Cladorrhinum samala]